MDVAFFVEQIQQKRFEICYPHSGSPPIDDEIVRQILTPVQQLPHELQLVVLELADPVSFAILRSVIKHDEALALYCNQLSKILHQSRLAQSVQGRPKEAYETYKRVLMARQCVLNAIQTGIFPLRTSFDIIKWKFAEDYGLMFTIETHTHMISVWTLRGDTVKCVWRRLGAADAVFITHLQRVLVSDLDGGLQIWDFADSPRLVESMPVEAPDQLFNSETYLLTIQDSGPMLWKWMSSSSLTRMRLPDSLISARLAEFSPNGHRVVVSNARDLWLVNLPPEDESPRSIQRDMKEPVFSLLWSADDRKIIAASTAYIELWAVDTTEVQPERYDIKDDGKHIASAAISPDGAFLALGCMCELEEAPTLHVLDISQGSPTEVYHGYHGYQEEGTGLTWFLDRHLAFAGEIIDIGKHIQREM